MEHSTKVMIITSPFKKNVLKQFVYFLHTKVWQEDTDIVPDRNVTEESLDKVTDAGEDNLVAVDNSVPAHEVHVGHWLAVPHQLSPVRWGHIDDRI